MIVKMQPYEWIFMALYVVPIQAILVASGLHQWYSHWLSLMNDTVENQSYSRRALAQTTITPGLSTCVIGKISGGRKFKPS